MAFGHLGKGSMLRPIYGGVDPTKVECCLDGAAARCPLRGRMGYSLHGAFVWRLPAMDALDMYADVDAR